MMKPKQRKISSHDSDQPIAGIVEAIDDSDEMLRRWEKKQEASEALSPAEKARLLKRITQRMQQNPLPPNAPYFTREELHER